jgi:integrase
MGRKALRRSAGKALSVDIYERGDRRYHVVWKDEAGQRCFASRGSLAEAKSFQTQKIAELERHREGRFNLDDREMLSQARELASSHGYTVLQAIQEWHSSKGSSKAMPLAEVIEKFVGAKSNRSAAYMDKLNADMRLFQSHFGADRSIDRIRSDEIEDFLDSKKAASRRRNNLRSEIITLFRYAQIRLRALHRDRKTEAELVLRDQTKRKPVETFSPKEFQTFLKVVRPEWLPWLALGGLAGIRTDGEIFRITWECFKWDRRIIDLSTNMTKIDERRHVPLCDRLIELLRPVCRDSGPVIDLKRPEDETARLQRVTGIRWRRNGLRHSFCSYRVAITGDIPLVSIESGNSVQMIKRCYWDVKHFDEGLRWFGLTLPIPVKRRQEPFLMPLMSFGSA